MGVYVKEAAKTYGYVLVDNQPKTTIEKQVISDVFGHRQRYPHITSSTHSVPDISKDTPVTDPRCIKPPEVKPQRPNQSAKRKAEVEKRPTKKQKTNIKNPQKQSKQAKMKSKAKMHYTGNRSNKTLKNRGQPLKSWKAFKEISTIEEDSDLSD